MNRTPENWPEVRPPDVWIVYRTNPLISFPQRELVVEVVKKFPFIVSIGYTMDETAWFADLVLPDHTDLEGLQLFRLGGLAHTFETFWEYYGFALKQPVVKPPYNTKDMTDLWTELAERLGILGRYNESINRGLLGAPLRGPGWDHRLDPAKKYTCEEIWDRVCRGATRSLSGGMEERDLKWFKEHGFYFVKFPKIRHYLHPLMVKWDLRYELPYLEGIKRVGEELGRRLHEQNIHWWDRQLEEYPALPECEDFSKIWEEFYGPGHDLWAISTKSLLYAHGSNVANPLYCELSKLVPSFGIKMHPKTAGEKGIKEGDTVIVEAKGRRVEGTCMVCEGVRPDCVVFVGQFGHKVTRFAKDLRMPNINDLTFLDLKLVDAIGGVAEIARVSVRPG
jgi:phenylacetyl-CoA:acceptor oxidoreductase